MILKFSCGCFLKTWLSEDNEEKGALACCIGHEQPYQKITDILPLELVEVIWE